MYLYIVDNIFEFKQFSVRQSSSEMKVGTDSVLLGAWADTVCAQRILDVGAGTGILSLMSAQRNPTAHIDAIELDNSAAKEAEYNFRNSPWNDRLSISNSDFLNFDTDRKFDYIISNPPYFDGGIKAPDSRRAMARHNDSLPFEKFFKKASSCLAQKGIIGIIAPVEVKEMIEFHAGENNLWIRRRVGVRTTGKKPIKRFLWEFANYMVEIDEGVITLQNADERTPEFVGLTKDFYIR